MATFLIRSVVQLMGALLWKVSWVMIYNEALQADCQEKCLSIIVKSKGASPKTRLVLGEASEEAD
jgi:hypothetical protein